MTFKVINPTLGDVVNRFDVKEINIPEQIDKADRAYTEWRQTKMEEKTDHLLKQRISSKKIKITMQN